MMDAIEAKTTVKIQVGEDCILPRVRECLKFSLPNQTDECRQYVLNGLFHNLPQYLEMDSDSGELPVLLNNLRLANLKVEIV